jgi:hypothetical protein
MGILMGSKKREVAQLNGESDESGVGVPSRDALWRNIEGL